MVSLDCGGQRLYTATLRHKKHRHYIQPTTTAYVRSVVLAVSRDTRKPSRRLGNI